MSNSNQEIIEARLATYIDGDLEPAERMEIEAHLEQNPQYRRLVEELRKGRQLLRRVAARSSPARTCRGIHVAARAVGFAGRRGNEGFAAHADRRVAACFCGGGDRTAHGRVGVDCVVCASGQWPGGSRYLRESCLASRMDPRWRAGPPMQPKTHQMTATPSLRIEPQCAKKSPPKIRRAAPVWTMITLPRWAKAEEGARSHWPKPVNGNWTNWR